MGERKIKRPSKISKKIKKIVKIEKFWKYSGVWKLYGREISGFAKIIDAKDKEKCVWFKESKTEDYTLYQSPKLKLDVSMHCLNQKAGWGSSKKQGICYN